MNLVDVNAKLRKKKGRKEVTEKGTERKRERRLSVYGKSRRIPKKKKMSWLRIKCSLVTVPKH